jgi:cytochrome c5
MANGVQVEEEMMRSGGDGRMALASAVGALTILAVGLVGCGRDPGDPSPEPSSVDYRQYFVEPIGVQPDQLPEPSSVGARLAGQFCAQCHGIPAPSSHSAADWRPILRNMYLRMDRMSRMGMMGGMMMGAPTRGMRTVVAPSAEEERDLTAYYREHALRALPEGAAPAAGPGQELFAKKCARCHALPDPRKYRSAQWPAVVARMRQHMNQMHVRDITDGQAKEIASYLETATSAGGEDGR